MSELGDRSTFAIQEFRGILIAPIQVELTNAFQDRLREALLEAVQRTGARAAIVNVAGLDVMDLEEFESLRRTMRMAEIMGARCILTGLRPGIVSALIALDADVEGLETALNVEQALTLLEPAPAQVVEQAAETDAERETGNGAEDDEATADG